jgi:HD-GYP domain-containing protein (c-di-GMP phosphodiesterase class II)
MGALLHEIGKIGVPDSILNKPGRLTDQEYEVVKPPGVRMDRHPHLKGLEQSGLYVLRHHENFDGTGYPARLKGHETPIGARIVSVIDAFDAMVSARPYRKGMPIPEALKRLHDVVGKQFDPAVVNSFTEFAQNEMASVIEAVGACESTVF